MYNPDTDLIFPPRAIPALSRERGAIWQGLVSDAQSAAPDSPEQIAFVLLVARLNNCGTCNADSYRAIHGCTTCTRQSLKRFHGTDEDLRQMYLSAVSEVNDFIRNKSEKN